MTDQSTPYLFKVGKQGFQRLNLLNAICNPGSFDFLQSQNVLKPGINALEVGCGTGQMAEIIARNIMPNGTLDIVDISDEQLKLAEGHLKKNNITNVDFFKLSAYDLTTKLKNKYDLIYSRLLLMHLDKPLEVINHFKRLLKPNGAIISEDSQAHTYFSEPPSKLFDKWLNIRLKIFHFDTNFGIRAPELYRQAGFDNITIKINQPILQTSEQKSFLRYAIIENMESFIGKDSAFSSEKQANEFINELKILEYDKSLIIGFMRLFQICTRI